MRPIRLLLLGAALLAAGCAERGRVIPVRMVTDESGNRFDPEVVVARRGDVLRFTLASGVHGIRLVAPGSTSSTLLQRPGETLDLPVEVPPGEYTFQCDPHVALGMTGRLTVR